MATRTNRKTTRKPASTRASAQAAGGNGDAGMSAEAVEELTRALKAARDGDFTQRLPSRRGSPTGQLGAAYNDLVEMLERMTKEFVRVGRVAKIAAVHQVAAAIFISARAVEMRRIWCKLAPRKFKRGS